MKKSRILILAICLLLAFQPLAFAELVLYENPITKGIEKAQGDNGAINVQLTDTNGNPITSANAVPTAGITTTITVTISSGTALSAEIDLGSYQLAAIQMPTAWDAANISFQATTASGGTYQDLYNDGGNEVVVVAAASRCIAVNAAAMSLAPLRYIKIRSGTTGTPVNQTATRTIILILKQ